MRIFFLRFFLPIHFHAVEFKHAALPHLADLVAVEEPLQVFNHHKEKSVLIREIRAKNQHKKARINTEKHGLISI